MAFNLDRRIHGLAESVGLGCTRYADDMALSSPIRLGRERVGRLVGPIKRVAHEEGFWINDRKTTARRAGERQRLAGVTVNQRINVDRRGFDRLKATLTNAARHGPTSQNHRGHPDFRAHLLGRVAWVEHLNSERGTRRRAIFESIDWDTTHA